MDRSSDLIQLMRQQFASSKRWLRYSILCNLGVVLISFLSSVDPIEQKSAIVPILLLFAQMIAFGLREKSMHDFSLAERIRRLSLLQDGLKIRLSNLQLKRIASRGNKSTEEPPYIGTYYASRLPQGPERLLEILSESCFYTEHIAGRAFKILTSLALGSCVAVIFLILSLVNLDADAVVLKTFTMVTVPFLSFWATGDLTYMALRFRELRKECSLILDKCEELDKAKRHDLTEILLLVDDYNCSLASSLPLPTRFYEADKADLNELWSARATQQE
ncbi:MAG: hypothetical protein HY562_03735 [Ignavibacteriales bacterium]|nr:hypothetical protein [Ignavibacteriales bacterium]